MKMNEIASLKILGIQAGDGEHEATARINISICGGDREGSQEIVEIIIGSQGRTESLQDIADVITNKSAISIPHIAGGRHAGDSDVRGGILCVPVGNQNRIAIFLAY